MDRIIFIYFICFFGLGIGIGGVFLLKKLKYLERSIYFFRILPKLYFVYIPIVFFFSFWFSGSLWTTAKLFEKEITKVIIDLEEEFFPIFMKDLNEGVDAYFENESIPSNDEIVSLFIEENLNIETSSYYKYTMRVCMTTLLELMIGKDSEKENRIRVLSEGVSRSLFTSGFGYLKNEASRRINQMLLLMSFPIIIGFLGAMTFPVLEIIISNIFYNETDEI